MRSKRDAALMALLTVMGVMAFVLFAMAFVAGILWLLQAMPKTMVPTLVLAVLGAVWWVEYQHRLKK